MTSSPTYRTSHHRASPGCRILISNPLISCSIKCHTAANSTLKIGNNFAQVSKSQCNGIFEPAQAVFARVLIAVVLKNVPMLTKLWLWCWPKLKVQRTHVLLNDGDAFRKMYKEILSLCNTRVCLYNPEGMACYKLRCREWLFAPRL